VNATYYLPPSLLFVGDWEVHEIDREKKRKGLTEINSVNSEGR